MSHFGTVRNGVVILDGELALPEGTRVTVANAEPTPTTRPLSPLAQGLLALAGKAVDLPPDMARNHKHYIHGATKR